MHSAYVYTEYVIKRKFVKGLHSSVRNSQYTFWSNNKQASLQKLACKATSVTKLQEAARGVDTSNSYWILTNCYKFTSGRWKST